MINKMGIKDLIYQKDEKEHLDQEQLKEEETLIKEMVKEQLAKYSNDEIHPFFKIPLELVKMVCDGYSSALIWEGQAGIGKTHLIENELIKKNVNYFMIAGYSSPRALVEALEEHKDVDVVWFDDLEGILADKVGKAVLKSCLDDRTGVRKIKYYTKKDKFDFILKARVIICMNTLPTDIDFQAVKDRCLYYKTELGYSDKMVIIQKIAEKYPEDLTTEQRMEIMEFLKQNTTEAFIDFSVRTYFKICNMYKFDKENWKLLSMGIVAPREEMTTLRAIMRKMVSVNEQIKEFKEATGLSRASFFRYKKVIEEPKHLEFLLDEKSQSINI
jgi:hypothetical protein